MDRIHGVLRKIEKVANQRRHPTALPRRWCATTFGLENMKAIELDILSLISVVVTSLTGRAVLFLLATALSSELGIWVGANTLVSPWESLSYLILAGFLMPTPWGFLAYPVIALTLIAYLWEEGSHLLLLVPVLFVTPHMYTIASEIGQ